MPGDFTEDCMALIADAVEESLDVLGGQYAADLKELLDVSVEYVSGAAAKPRTATVEQKPERPIDRRIRELKRRLKLAKAKKLPRRRAGGRRSRALESL